jgi:integrase
LRWEDLDLSKGVLRVQKIAQRVGGQLLMEDTKSADSDRSVPLPEITWKALKPHKSHQAEERLQEGKFWRDHGLVFPTAIGTPIEPRNLNRHWDAMRKRVGMDTVRLHDLRHTMVTLLLKLGVPPGTR